jgi:hypothetical protein
MMSQYKYSPLKGDSSIRLIKFDSSSTPDSPLLSIQLTAVQLRETGSFEALSYTWGDLSNKVPIKIGDRMLMITPNLNSFLMRLKADEAARTKQLLAGPTKYASTRMIYLSGIVRLR